MTTTTPPGPAAPASPPSTGGPSSASDGTAVTAGGGIDRLNAFDGLFLRAEHLNRIQDYALALARSVAAAGGPGVVEGFGVTIEEGKLLVQPGLAVNAGGRVLRAEHPMTLPLPQPASASTFWWVQVVPEQWGFGDAAVTGTLCDEPCSGGTSARLFVAEGVELQLPSATEGDLEGVPFGRRRPWLASRLFAEEQLQAGYWTGDVASLENLPLPQPLVTQPPAAVRLAVLISPPTGGGEFQLDIWTARRERGDPPPTQFRQWRLSMRPWQVFVAQVLQFQDALADRLPEFGLATARTWRDRVLQEIGVVSAELPNVTKAKAHDRLERLRREAAEGFTSELQEIEAALSATLPELGFDELPPAGYLPYEPPTGEAEVVGRVAGVAAEIDRLAPGLDVRVCTCRPVDVAQAVQEAQHRDRIPLGGGPDDQPAVDVLVPVGDDREVPLFDWVAFVRRDGRQCPVEEVEAPEETVVVYLIDDSGNESEAGGDAETLGGGRLPPGDGTPVADRVQELGRLTYPQRGWALPDDAVYDDVFGKLQDLAGQVTVFAFVSEDERSPLGAVRAFLLAGRFGGQRAGPQFQVVVTDEPEAVVVLVAPVKTEPEH